MKVLHLTLKKKWFDMIASGEKKEEYREVKQYYATRFCDMHIGAIGGDFMDNHKVIAYTFKKFDVVCFKNGYNLHAPKLIIECVGIEKGFAKPEWSDNWRGEVFIVKLGKVLNRITGKYKWVTRGTLNRIAKADQQKTN